MDIQQHFEIAGSGVYFPKNEVDADQIDARIGKPAGWTREKIGVNRRFECLPPESIATMAREAVTGAMADANVSWSEIDLILDCSTSQNRPIPCNAVHVQAMFGPEAQSIPCFDIGSTCLGFLVAMNVANGLMQSGTYRNVLLVCSEAPLKAVNWSHAESATLLGDAAAAFVLRHRETPGEGVYRHESYSDYIEACAVDGGGHRLPPYEFSADNLASYQFRMDGQIVMRAAIKHLLPMTEKMMSRAVIERDRLHVVPHQASPKALHMMRRLLKFPEDRFHNHIADYGNLVAASIPVTLHQCLESGKITEGDQVMILGTSAGYSQAGMVFDV